MELQLVKPFHRASWSNFIIPAPKFLKTVDYPFCIGMRFKARVESEDASERRLYLKLLTELLATPVILFSLSF